MRDHRKLRAFELADELVLDVYRVSKGFPREEQFGLTSQIRRAALSIASNIVEGCARDTESEFFRFMSIAYGSAREVEYQLSIAARLGYLPDDTFAAVNDRSQQTSKVLGALVRSNPNRQLATP